MSIQTTHQNNVALAGLAPINVTASLNSTESLPLLNTAFEKQRHIDLLETLRERKLPFLEKLISQIDTIKRLYQQAGTFQEIQMLELSLEAIQKAKYKKEGYFSRFFSHESWDEWTEDKTNLGKIISIFEDHVQNGLPLKYFNWYLDKHPIEKSELEARVLMESLSKESPHRSLRSSMERRLDTYTSFPLSNWTLPDGEELLINDPCTTTITEPCIDIDPSQGVAGIRFDTNTLTLPNVFLSGRVYTLKCLKPITSTYRKSMDLSVFSDFFSLSANAPPDPGGRSYSLSFKIPEGYNGPLTLELFPAGGAALSSIFVTPALSLMPVPPVIKVSIPSQVAYVGRPFFYPLPPNVFSEPQGGPLALTATLNTGAPLPAWVYFNTKSFSGTPFLVNKGNFEVNLTATNEYDQPTSQVFSLQVQHVLPVLTHQIPDQNVALGQTFSYTFPSNTFSDPVGNFLTYTAMQDNDTLLPSWISFNTQTFTGTPALQDIGNISVSVIAIDAYQGTANTTFNLRVNHILPVAELPIQPQIAALGQLFNFIIPANTFFDPIGNELTFSAIKSDQSPLPAWITFNGQTLSLSGTPTSGDDGILSILVTAQDPFQGHASTTFLIQVQHVLPVLINPISNLKCAINAPFTYKVPSNTFFDSVGNPLTVTANTSNGEELPSWLTFDSKTGQFSGTPPLSSVGTISLQVIANDPFEGMATSSFDLIVQNAAPVLNTPCKDQAATSGSLYLFPVPPNTFSNPAGVTLTFNATKTDGNALPAWLQFNPHSLIFSGTPAKTDLGTFSIQLIATNAYSQSTSTTFSLSIQEGSSISNLSLIEYGLKVGIPTLLFSAIVGMLLRRKMRIQSTQEKIMAIDSTVSTLASITSDDLEEEFSKLQEESSHISEYNAARFQNHFLAFLEQVNAFCLEHPEESLFEIVNIRALLNNLLIKIHDKTFRGASKEVALILSQTIHQLCDLILLTETASGRQINETIKRKFLQKLDDTIGRIPNNNTNVRLSDIRFHLESAREAIRCMIDTTSVCRLVKQSVYHILSPGALASDMKALFSNVPDQWYPALLGLRSMAPTATDSLETLQKLQQLISTQSDWRFYYESIGILGNIAKNGATEEIRSQALNGTATEPGLIKFLQWAPFRINKDRNLWLQNKAKDEHGGISKERNLSPDLEIGEGIEMKEEKTEPFSMEAIRELPMQEMKSSYSSRLIGPPRELSGLEFKAIDLPEP